MAKIIIMAKMAKICCHVNQCNLSVQYFAILHPHKYCMMSGKLRQLKINSFNLYTLRISVASQHHAIELAAKTWVFA